MRVLVYGAGVLGSLFAAKLKDAGEDVTILARGQRADDLQRFGLVLEDETTGKRTETAVPVIRELTPEDRYDVVLVLVRADNLAEVLPSLAANRSSTLLFMTNNAGRIDNLAQAVGRERVLLGFAGAGGARDGHVVRARVLTGRLQGTTLGERSGGVTPRLRAVAELLNRAGFPTIFSNRMEAWLKTHAAVVAPIALAMYFAGDNYRLARSTEGLRLLIGAVREALSALRLLGIPVEPGTIRVVLHLPDWLLLWLLRRTFATRRAELVMWRHANHARAEMLLLAEEVRALITQSSQLAPAFDRLMNRA